MFIPILLFILLLIQNDIMAAERSRADLVREVIRTTEPLSTPRGERLPLYLWATMDLGTDDEAEIAEMVSALDARGIAVMSNWLPDNPQALEKALRVGRIQQRLGAPIAANATSLTYSLFNGDPKTAWKNEAGEPYFDDSFGGQKMGNPFVLDFRVADIRQRLETYLSAYKQAGLDLHFLWADWEIDGPIEWNGSWEAARRDPSVRALLPEVDHFDYFQKAIRRERSRLQNAFLAQPALKFFPDVLVGNYAVYLHDGFRYWFDYFEYHVPDTPHIVDQKARYRQWYDEFPATGYTYGMPVVYTWQDTYTWYDFDVPDYRWFYNMLLVGSNPGKATPHDIPLVTFVHWHTIVIGERKDVPQFSESAYQELLWHLLLRGHDTLYSWSSLDESVKEAQLVHQVYQASHQYVDFLLHGEPLVFDVPATPGPVISALRLGNRLLVRRTDFDERSTPVPLVVGDVTLQIPRSDGVSQVFELD